MTEQNVTGLQYDRHNEARAYNLSEQMVREIDDMIWSAIFTCSSKREISARPMAQFLSASILEGRIRECSPNWL